MAVVEAEGMEMEKMLAEQEEIHLMSELLAEGTVEEIVMGYIFNNKALDSQKW